MKRTVELTDLLRYHFLSSPTFSPDSKKICFSLHQADRENNRYISNIWIYDLEKEDLIEFSELRKKRDYEEPKFTSMSTDDIKKSIQKGTDFVMRSQLG